MVKQGKSEEVLKELGDNTVHSIVCDPPYELGFMGKKWDSTGIAYSVDFWRECFRVLRPGGHLLAFGGSRTYHRLAVAVEDAGFEIRDQIMWVYGSGFPKSMNIGKAVDKRNETTADQSREFAEYIKQQRIANNITLSKVDEIVCNGTTNYSWFEGRPAGQRLPRKTDYLKIKELLKLDDRYDSFMEEAEREVIGMKQWTNSIHHFIPGENHTERVKLEITKGTSEYEGYGTALKPAHEPIVMARKPKQKGLTVAENVLKWGTGGINIDGCRVGLNGEKPPNGSAKRVYKNNGYNDEAIYGENKITSSEGRFPANFIHDGSDEVLTLFPMSKSVSNTRKNKQRDTMMLYGHYDSCESSGFDDEGSAARFFYCAKASGTERNAGLEGFEYVRRADRTRADLPGGDNPRNRTNKPLQNHHPTVKPIKLMRYLIRLVTPKGGTVLDPFAGSGTTGCAAELEGFDYILIENEEEYIPIIEARTAYWRK